MALHLRENLLSRQNQEPTWHEADPALDVMSLLQSLGTVKDIPTRYGLNGSRLGDPHKKLGEPDDYPIARNERGEVEPGPAWQLLFRWLIGHSQEILDYDSVYIVTDNHDLVDAEPTKCPGLAHWPLVAAWWKERVQHVGPYKERTTVFFVPIVLTLTFPMSIRLGLVPLSLMPACTFSQPSTLSSLTVTVCP